MRHGAEPWFELAVKLLLKWPNLYYSTAAFAPKTGQRKSSDFANTRGADKVIYGGYFPMGLDAERIFREMDDVPFKEEVWPKFLRDNAERVLGLAGRTGKQNFSREDAKARIGQSRAAGSPSGFATALPGGIWLSPARYRARSGKSCTPRASGGLGEHGGPLCLPA